MFLATLLALWAWAGVGVTQDAPVEVALRQGRISGASERAGWGRHLYSFRGIPYAEAPKGALRFRDPQAAGSWVGVRNGSFTPPVCPQVDATPGEGGEAVVKGEEDCLYLNVFTPRPFVSDLPVMVWLHGGAFLVGGAGEYAPLPLLTRDVVLVTLQYRLGTLGFLSTEDSVLPGNLGLKDQTMALRWVKDNIRDLGGDPDKVTLFGQGAGAASAHFQVLSQHAKGLFRRAILQSGNALTPWALRKDHKETAFIIGQVFNCSAANKTSNSSSAGGLNSTALLDCLRKLPFQQLTVIPSAFVTWLSTPQVMTPRVDGAFLRAHPASLLQSGIYNEVDLISGVTEVEAALPALATLSNPTLQKALFNDFASVAPATLGMEGEVDSSHLARKVFNAYLPGAQVNEGSVRSLAQLLSDGAYNVPNAEVLRLHCKRGRGRVFAYRLQHRGLFGATDLFNSSVGYMWVSNGDDLKYLFRGGLALNSTSNMTSRTTSRSTFSVLESKSDQRLSNIMVRLWTNFAATGYPTPDPFLGFMWAPACTPTIPYLSLTPAPTMFMDRNARTYAFWRSLPTLRNRILRRESFAPAPWKPSGTGQESFSGRFPSGVFELLFGRRGLSHRKYNKFVITVTTPGCQTSPSPLPLPRITRMILNTLFI
ncbi:venom carboxylesterase-6-like [Penaeus japonicus]|uniref:venom carboxylesterase-6-like n=1 Tax=Penaeus japonicus TaxID=27405 RepID=UPI001C712E0E|nr:venom carboxylesterase-6-like [Penaeus japonicus]